MSGRWIDQMMAALAKKNLKQQHLDQHRDPVTGEVSNKPRRGTGPVSGNKPQRKAAGRGR